jgi:dihydrolipoamide dehydrogenase
VAIGRQSNIDDLGLENLGVALDPRGMPPFDPTTMRIAELQVFLAGDVNGQVPLLHEAADEGHIAGLNATRETCHCFTRRTPLAIVFCDPNVAMVGQRFEKVDASSAITGEADFTRQGRARTAESNKGLMHIYAEKSSGRLLGAEMCVPAAEHMIHLLALAMERNLTVWEVLRLPFYHPVLEEGLRGALRQLAQQLPAGDESDLATCGSFHCEALD